MKTITDQLQDVDDPLALLAGLIALSPVAYQVYRPDGHSMLVNDAFRRLFGSEPPPEYNILEDEVAARTGVLPLIHRAFTGQTVFVPATWYDPRDLTRIHVTEGRRCAFESTFLPLRNRQGAVTHVVVTFKDVTDVLQAQEGYQRLLDSASAVERQEENRRKPGRNAFMANVSHELRTPLNSILGFTDVLLHDADQPLEPVQREYLEHVYTSAQHLLQVINSVLDLTKAEAGTLRFQREPVDVTEVVQAVTKAVTPIAQEKQIEVDTQITLQDVVNTDVVRLRQVLYNYLSNSLKFTPSRGHVTLRVCPDGEGYFRVEVQDDGIGIATADIHRLFTEFVQLERGYAGTGLGLALCKRLVEAQGGTVGVSSERGRGSTFFARLPAV